MGIGWNVSLYIYLFIVKISSVASTMVHVGHVLVWVFSCRMLEKYIQLYLQYVRRHARNGQIPSNYSIHMLQPGPNQRMEARRKWCPFLQWTLMNHSKISWLLSSRHTHWAWCLRPFHPRGRMLLTIQNKALATLAVYHLLPLAVLPLAVAPLHENKQSTNSLCHELLSFQNYKLRSCYMCSYTCLSKCE